MIDDEYMLEISGESTVDSIAKQPDRYGVADEACAAALEHRSTIRFLVEFPDTFCRFNQLSEKVQKFGVFGVAWHRGYHRIFVAKNICREVV